MRPIKFRAWHTTLKRMFSSEEMGLDQLTLSVDGRGFVNVSGDSISQSQFAGEVMIPMQFTGLLDKNGKEIYEGDIILFAGGKKPWNIGWNQKTARWVGYCTRSAILNLFDDKRYEVIGNIYENPELLKEPKA